MTKNFSITKARVGVQIEGKVGEILKTYESILYLRKKK